MYSVVTDHSQSANDQDSSVHKAILVGQMLVYLALSLWLSRYVDLMFKVSRNALLEVDICGDESLQNMHSFTKINISNFSFVASALGCKLISSAILVIRMLGLLSNDADNETSNLRAIRVLDSASFVFLLVACSLQLYKWIMIILRVQYFGHG